MSANTSDISLDAGVLLFVYGTLRSDLMPAGVRERFPFLVPLGQGVVRGRLYDLGPYPGAVYDPESLAVIRGELCRLAGKADWCLRQLDRYEGVDENEPARGLYVRLPVTVQLDQGGTATAWMYQYNQSLEGARLVEGGEWGERRKDEG